jgi:FHA domain
LSTTLPSTSTYTDPAAPGWFDDDVIQFREWNTDLVHPIPATSGEEFVLGASRSCRLRLVDPTGRVSRQHARLFCERGRWRLVDLGSTNGMYIGGARHPEVMLTPGIEVVLGGITLIAESSRLLTLRAFLCRLLGWSEANREAVNVAMRSLRAAGGRQTPLMLAGADDLIALAHGLHDRMVGRAGPFVLCDPTRRRAPASVRLAANEPSAVAALAAASNGTVCVSTSKLPPDFEALTDALKDPLCRTLLMLCNADVERAHTHRGTLIRIPPIETRASELDRIVQEYAADVRSAMATAAEFPEEDLDWIRKHSSDSLPEIEKGTSRLMALRTAGTVAGAANLLGMSHVALRGWIGRRDLPIPTERLSDPRKRS